MVPRFLPLICLLMVFRLLTPAQQSAVKQPDKLPDSCRVTKPPSDPFSPPHPYSAKADTGWFLYGSNELWTMLPTNGTWRLSNHPPSYPSFRQKQLWWREGYDAHAEPEPRLKLTGKRLDSSAPPLTAKANGAASGWPKNDFMVVGIDFPTVGCWEVTGHYESDDLTFVVWVSP